MHTYKITVLSDEQYKDYQTRLNNHILPVIGSLRLKDVKAIHLQKIMRNINQLSGSRIKKIYQCLNQMLSAAETNELIAKNPAEKIEVPVGEDGTHRPLTDEERSLFLKATENHEYGLLFRLILYTGIRPVEAANCKKAHFDFKKKLLYVETAKQKPGKKSNHASRYIPVPQEILDAVKLVEIDPFEFLFTTNNGTKLNKEAIRRRWKAIKREMHIQAGGKIYQNAIIPPCMVADDLTPYCLRHTFCTDLQDAGVPINVAKELMGHSDISLTAKIYTHYTETSLENASRLLDKFRNSSNTSNENVKI